MPPLFQALPYVALLIAMLFFIYAVIGMQVSPGPLGWRLLGKGHLHQAGGKGQAVIMQPAPPLLKSNGDEEGVAWKERACGRARLREREGMESTTRPGWWYSSPH